MDRVNAVWDVIVENLKNGASIDDAAKAAHLGRDVGLNADWSSSAWLIDGAFYLVDDEAGGAFVIKRPDMQDDESMTLVRHFTP